MNEHLRDLEALARDIPLAKRKGLGDVFARLGAACDVAAEQLRHLTWPTPSWPNRGESSASADDVYRYAVDFGYGDRPDHRNFVATFEQVRKLLNYTKDSCKVAFGTNKGRIDRTQRPTRLGPCVLVRLPHAVKLEDYPDVLPFQVKLDEQQRTSQLTTNETGRKVRRPAGGNKY